MHDSQISFLGKVRCTESYSNRLHLPANRKLPYSGAMSGTHRRVFSPHSYGGLDSSETATGSQTFARRLTFRTESFIACLNDFLAVARKFQSVAIALIPYSTKWSFDMDRTCSRASIRRFL